MSDDELLAAELDAIRSALEAARAQLINLNDAIDDFWNDPTRPSVVTMRSGTVSNLSIAQLDARASLAKIDAALASLDAPQPDALREAENAVSHAFGLLSSAVRCGEAWRQELDDAKDRARAALARLKGEGAKPAPDVEKVAGALFRAQMISTRSWEETDEDIRESYRVNARAAIAAMEG